jgi:hypothetical protein
MPALQFDVQNQPTQCDVQKYYIAIGSTKPYIVTSQCDDNSNIAISQT